uniref:Uncharacterized protein n=1 Tax=Parascaris equorum TaxID=6256 RepID=A0A914S725_PAREQ
MREQADLLCSFSDPVAVWEILRFYRIAGGDPFGGGDPFASSNSTTFAAFGEPFGAVAAD